MLQPPPLASTTTFRAETDRLAIPPGEIELHLRSFEQSYRTGRVLLLAGGAVAARMLAGCAVRGDHCGMTGGSAAGYMTAWAWPYGGYRMHVSRVRLGYDDRDDPTEMSSDQPTNIARVTLRATAIHPSSRTPPELDAPAGPGSPDRRPHLCRRPGRGP